MSDDSESSILEFWQQNASAWTRAVREKTIASRRRITDQAIVDAVFAEPFASALDIGCGEGWLCRAIQERGARATGIDAVAELVESAQRLSAGDYRCMSYRVVTSGNLAQQFDLAVCNFSLLGGDSVDALVGAIPMLLEPGGRVIVQTLHPRVYAGAEYRDGWRSGSWAGFSSDFRNPAPWYFRTVESWVELFQRSGFRQLATVEPRNPASGQSASIIFIARTGDA
ncbi:methyltransferase domain-containing protein [Proteobacteria bacterium 005FR1]|nr:methyltransferase domain-containing protein [Proteobacteria bacterium 005FR1]